MFLRSTNRRKDGKDHRYYSVVEDHRLGNGRVIQKTLLYLGEINSSQKDCWARTIEVIEGKDRRQIKLFSDGAVLSKETNNAVLLRIKELQLRNPRQWGACWLGCELWKKLSLGEFWRGKLDVSRKGTQWAHVLQTLVISRLIEPGSEWRLHRYWYDHSAMGDLLGEDASLAQKDTLYRCHDKILRHKDALFGHLRQQWEDIFGIQFDVLLYDLTSTYFESDPSFEGKRKFGYSRDKRFDCVQVVIALVVTKEGFPLAYEVFAGNTQDKQTLKGMLETIGRKYGEARRIWVMGRGIPTEEVLQEMREAKTPVLYLVGTPKGRLSRYEAELLSRPWENVREQVKVKFIEDQKEVYVLVESEGRKQKERGMRLRRIRKLLERLKEILVLKTNDRDNLLKKVGAAEKEAGRCAGLFTIHIPRQEDPINETTFYWKINRNKYRQTRKREGQYLLRTNQTVEDPSELWKQYLILTNIEESFRNLKGDLAIRPVHHQLESRIEAHIFISFLAYCLHVTLKQMARAHAPGLTPRSILEQMKTIQMIDVHIPTTDGRELRMSRYTRPEKQQQLLLAQLKLTLPDQPPPEISAPQKSCSEDLSNGLVHFKGLTKI
jgi:transposase